MCPAKLAALGCEGALLALRGSSNRCVLPLPFQGKTYTCQCRNCDICRENDSPLALCIHHLECRISLGREICNQARLESQKKKTRLVSTLDNSNTGFLSKVLTESGLAAARAQATLEVISIGMAPSAIEESIHQCFHTSYGKSDHCGGRDMHFQPT